MEKLKTPKRLLIVDDDEVFLKQFQNLLETYNFQVTAISNPRQTLKILKEKNFDCIILDVDMPGMDGLTLLKKIFPEHVRTPVIMLSGVQVIRHAVQSLKFGAVDFVEKMENPDIIIEKIQNIIKQSELISLKEVVSSLKAELKKKFRIIFKSKEMQRVLWQIQKAANTDAPVLLLGETGVGKSYIARVIHSWSQRSLFPFTHISMADINSNLIESELFGHVKGAFTGATRDKTGKIASTDKGTIFFDEIGELPLEVQPKLNLFLDTGRFYPVGSQKEVSVDVRIIAATNREEHELREGKNFRSDLYYRLSTIVIKIPPLRRRPEDIWPLAQYFFEKYKHFNPGVKGLHPLTKPLLEQYQWPGNVRELENFISRLIIMAEGDFIDKDDVRTGLSDIIFRDEPSHLSKKNVLLPLKEARAEFERDYILFILKNVGNSRTKAAEILGIDRVHLQRKIKQLKINTL